VYHNVVRFQRGGRFGRVFVTKTFVWILLVIYSALHLLTNGRFSVDIAGLVTFTEEPYAVALFNLMGVFPLFFLLEAIAFGHKGKTIGLHALGFAFGAFALLPLTRDRHERIRITPVIRSIAAVGTLVAGGLVAYAFRFGSWTAFWTLFMSDSLIHIMTIDFIALYWLSIRNTYRLFGFWPVACLPVIGPLALLTFSKGDISK
jgi:hypothetical protein